MLRGPLEDSVIEALNYYLDSMIQALTKGWEDNKIPLNLSEVASNTIKQAEKAKEDYSNLEGATDGFLKALWVGMDERIPDEEGASEKDLKILEPHLDALDYVGRIIEVRKLTQVN